MRWIFAALAVLLSGFVLMPIRYRHFYGGPLYADLGLKVIPTLLCASFAGVACFSGGDRYSLLVFIGLCICAAADVLLGIRFAVGGALFFAGHVCYISAFLSQHAVSMGNLLAFAVVLPCLWRFCQKYRPLIQNRLIAYGIFIYSAALAVVLGLSLPLPFRMFSQRSILAAVGAVLFVISDMGVCHGVLVNTSKSYSFRMLAVYYLAQLCLGISAFGG